MTTSPAEQTAAIGARTEESVIAGFNFVLPPLTFLSSIFMSEKLMPHWMEKIALVCAWLATQAFRSDQRSA
jgi:hypothetical protein